MIRQWILRNNRDMIGNYRNLIAKMSYVIEWRFLHNNRVLSCAVRSGVPAFY